ncbi:hypothetical protein [Corynebacterium cystitidis]|uniref:hypothetical protein n=1 Tax=Corynebacterium cystitidis TaxID=35757 RepID=UPI00211F2CEC|nr:hypothetical protein [Corynebacterium cystitidis]
MPIEKEWFPANLKRPARGLRAWAQTSGPGLLGAGVLSMLHGLSYLGIFGHYAAFIHPVENLVSTRIWASAWLMVGVWLVIVSITHFKRTSTLIYTLWAVLMLVWSASWAMGWGRGDIDRGVALSGVYFLIPLLIAWVNWLIGTLQKQKYKEVPDDD